MVRILSPLAVDFYKLASQSRGLDILLQDLAMKPAYTSDGNFKFCHWPLAHSTPIQAGGGFHFEWLFLA